MGVGGGVVVEANGEAVTAAGVRVLEQAAEGAQAAAGMVVGETVTVVANTEWLGARHK